MRRCGTFISTICSFRGGFGADPKRREIAWGDIQHHDVLRVLHQPAYAGAYVFGRTHVSRTADGKIHIEDLPRSEWIALVKDAHVGYITWEEFERNEAQLAMNSQAYAPQRFSPPREGPALAASAAHLWQVWRTHERALSPARRSTHRSRLAVCAQMY